MPYPHLFLFGRVHHLHSLEWRRLNMLSYNWAMVWNSISDGDGAGYSCPSGMMEKLQELIFLFLAQDLDGESCGGDWEEVAEVFSTAACSGRGTKSSKIFSVSSSRTVSRYFFTENEELHFFLEFSYMRVIVETKARNHLTWRKIRTIKLVTNLLWKCYSLGLSPSSRLVLPIKAETKIKQRRDLV